MPKISVVIPVYNVEKYLKRCISSVLASENDDLQVLLIDDGSTDSSGRICDFYANKDHRIRAIHKKNGGVSCARNMAIPLIEGEWTVFVDADDAISPDFLNIPTNADSADVIEKGFAVRDENGKLLNFNRVSYKVFDRKALVRYYANHHINAVWNKIIKSVIVKECRFEEELALGEDLLFFLSVLSRIRTYQLCHEGYYIYTERQISAKNKDAGNMALRVKYLLTWSNVIDRNLERYKVIYPLHTTVLYSVFLRELYIHKKELTQEELIYVGRRFAQMKWSDLSLLPFKTRLRLMFWHLRERFAL